MSEKIPVLDVKPPLNESSPSSTPLTGQNHEKNRKYDFSSSSVTPYDPSMGSVTTSRVSLKKSYENSKAENNGKNSVTAVNRSISRKRSMSRIGGKAVGKLKDDYRDEYIDDVENIGTTQYDDIAIWAHTRQKLYPYAQNKKLYVNNAYPLISPHGRVRSYVGFAGNVHFDTRLYPSDFLEQLTYVMEHEYGIPPKEGRSRRLPIPTNRVNLVPALDYIEEEPRIKAKNGWDNDIYEDTVLFQGLPRELIVGLKANPKTSTLPTMYDEIKLYASRRYRYISGLLPENISPNVATADQLRKANRIPAVYHGAIENSEDTDYFRVKEETPYTTQPSDIPKLEQPYYEGMGVDSINVANIQNLQKKRESELGHAANIDGVSYLRKLVGDEVMVQLDVITVALIKSMHNPKPLTTNEKFKVVNEIQRNSLPAVYDGIPMEKAPHFYMELIMAISKYPLEVSDILSIMSAKFGPNLQTWLNNEIINVSMIDDNLKLPVILKNFRSQYMGQRLILELQRKLRDTKLLAIPNTQEEMNLHYSTWTKYKVALCMCDSSYTDTKLMLEFLSSFPASLVTGVPLNGAGMKTINDAWNIISITASGVYDRFRTMAILGYAAKKRETGANAIQVFEDQEYDEYRVNTSINAVNSKTRGNSALVNKYSRCKNESVEDESSDDDTSFAQTTVFYALRQLAPMDKQDMKCFHCGVKGHMVGECEFAKKNLPQTTKGQVAWAEFCKLRGEARVYDLKYQLERHEQWQKFKRNNPKRMPQGKRGSRKKPETVTVDDEGDATPVDDEVSAGSTVAEDVVAKPRRLLREKDLASTNVNVIYHASDIDMDENSDFGENGDGVEKTYFSGIPSRRHISGRY